MKHSRKTNDNKEVTENMKIRQDIDPEWALSLFVQLYKSIYYWKIDGKDIANIAKLVNKLLWCLLVLGINGRYCQDHILIGGKNLFMNPLMRESHRTKNI